MMTEKEFNHMILPLTKNIYAYAQHILSNPTDAADITQEVMIKLWNTRRELKGVQNPRAWALKVTRNLCLDWIKTKTGVRRGRAGTKRRLYKQSLAGNRNQGHREPSPANHRHSAGKSTGGAHPAGNRRTGI